VSIIRIGAQLYNYDGSSIEDLISTIANIRPIENIMSNKGFK